MSIMSDDSSNLILSDTECHVDPFWPDPEDCLRRVSVDDYVSTTAQRPSTPEVLKPAPGRRAAVPVKPPPGRRSAVKRQSGSPISMKRQRDRCVQSARREKRRELIECLRVALAQREGESAAGLTKDQVLESCCRMLYEPVTSFHVPCATLLVERSLGKTVFFWVDSINPAFRVYFPVAPSGQGTNFLLYMDPESQSWLSRSYEYLLLHPGVRSADVVVHMRLRDQRMCRFRLTVSLVPTDRENDLPGVHCFILPLDLHAQNNISVVGKITPRLPDIANEQSAAA